MTQRRRSCRCRRRWLRHFARRPFDGDAMSAHVLVGGDADGVDVDVEETEMNQET